MDPFHIWMDQGGTFTDVVRIHESGKLDISKVLSDQASLEDLGRHADEVRRGTTVATNALLERTGAPVLLLTNVGFGDMPMIGDQRRPDLFSLKIERPKSLATAVLEVAGRISAQGRVLAPLSVDEDALVQHRNQGINSVAIVLINGPLHPATELALERICQEVGFEHISVGHQIAPSRGYLARLNTTLADAALTPLLPSADGLYMRSDGGLSQVEEWSGANAVLSGPAGGVVATAAIAKAAGVGAAFGLDMGGTSTDVCRVEDGPERTDHLEIGGMHLRVPSLKLETVAAGGGSLLTVVDGILTVGPRSAGAVPGPAAYGRGGPATLTDAEAVLGRLPKFPHVCGPDRDHSLDLEAAHAAIKAVSPGIPTEECAAGFKRVAAETAAKAVRTLAASRGVDPASHALVAFGGAGPGHGCAIADALGIQTIIVPRMAGVFSAVGVGLARRRAEVVAPIGSSIATAITKARDRLPFSGEVHIHIACRHTGTQHTLDVPTEEIEKDELSDIQRDTFHHLHEQRFGFSRPELEVEAVEVRLVVEAHRKAPPIHLLNEATPDRTARAWFDGWKDVPLLAMGNADGREGPLILHGGGTTVIVEPGWRVAVEKDWVRLDQLEPRERTVGTTFHPVHTAIFATRAMAIAEHMGERLARLARSVSIRERRDFSCALFDDQGRLVANAPHVPVHLGAMGETVRDLLKRRSDQMNSGQTWATNDPYAGGSHLPDITVIRPIYRGRERVGFVACRGHHVDVGGTTPGSMPPHSTTIGEEGFRLRAILLADDHGFHRPPLPGCRQPDEVIADLMAQTAACADGETQLQGLISEMGLHGFRAQLAHLLGTAARSVARVLQENNGTHTAMEVLDDGTKIRVEFHIEGDRGTLTIDADAHPGNLNAPSAVARAALLYVLRSLVADPLPLLNEGSLSPVTITINPGGLFDPIEPAAVAGGNVESSQRLVDAILRALHVQAASQGTMNNLTVGTRVGAWYETIGGGSGAGPGFHGTDGVQVHMTNTRATDVEELEARFPVRLDSWSRRTGSGGRGEWRGGNGIEKCWTFLDHAEVSLLAERRVAGAPGAAGGMPGLPGLDEINSGTGWEPMPLQWTAKAGDRLRIKTPGGGGFGPSSEEDYDCGAV
jgi:5-oxoprolinase (ATP-hydrolysing)